MPQTNVPDLDHGRLRTCSSYYHESQNSWKALFYTYYSKINLTFSTVLELERELSAVKILEILVGVGKAQIYYIVETLSSCAQIC